MCRRIAEREPLLRAFVPEPDRCRRLAWDAGELFQRYPGSGSRPALFSIPVGVKDIVNVAGLSTAAGSRLPPELFAGPEATVVTRLREAGALIAGKTATTELAFSEAAATTNPH
ncbi:MAG: amidase family protein, partial [Acidimicrobiia bacterium]